MKFFRQVKPRFRVWEKPIQEIPLPELAANPFPGKRKYRWAVFTMRHGLIYEGKASRQAFLHAVELAIQGQNVTLLEADKSNTYSKVAFHRHSGELQRIATNISLWSKYHKMEVVRFYYAWRTKGRGILGRKAKAVRIFGQ